MSKIIRSVFAILFILLFSSCAKSPVEVPKESTATAQPPSQNTLIPQPSQTVTQTLTPAPTLTATITLTSTPLPPLGESGNPITIALVPGNPDLTESFVEQMTMLINLQSEKSVKIVLLSSFDEVKEQLCEKKIHAGTLNTGSYLEAYQEGCAVAYFVSTIDERSTTSSAFFVNVKSGIEDMTQLQGLTICRSSTNHWGNWLLPVEVLKMNEYDLETDFAYVDKESVFEAIEGVYNEECDLGFGAENFLWFMGEENFPGIFDVVQPIGYTPQIPFPNISFHPDLPSDTELELINVMFSLRRYSDEQGKLITRLYNWDDLIYTDNSFYNVMWDGLTPTPAP